MRLSTGLPPFSLVTIIDTDAVVGRLEPAFGHGDLRFFEIRSYLCTGREEKYCSPEQYRDALTSVALRGKGQTGLAMCFHKQEDNKSIIQEPRGHTSDLR